MKRLAAYCGPAAPADPAYMELAREVGGTLARRGIGVVYGGGRLGLMGAVAGAALAAGGTDEGEPGLRPYGDGYYLAYVRDPAGNKLSAFYKPKAR